MVIVDIKICYNYARPFTNWWCVHFVFQEIPEGKKKNYKGVNFIEELKAILWHSVSSWIVTVVRHLARMLNESQN